MPTLPDLPMIDSIGRRARDISPMHPRLRAIVVEHMQANPRTKSLESTGRLEGSINNVDIWRAQRLSVEWGTPVEYFWYHSAWRKRRLLPPLTLVSKKVMTEALGAVSRYVVDGRRS